VIPKATSKVEIPKATPKATGGKRKRDGDDSTPGTELIAPLMRKIESLEKQLSSKKESVARGTNEKYVENSYLLEIESEKRQLEKEKVLILQKSYDDNLEREKRLAQEHLEREKRLAEENLEREKRLAQEHLEREKRLAQENLERETRNQNFFGKNSTDMMQFALNFGKTLSEGHTNIVHGHGYQC